MAAEFSRLLTLLRKEKGISQKSAAQQLGVSQALLSHYENGIRECGLDFLVRAADFYGVSCDYILGRTPDRNGLTLTIDELPGSDAAGKENSYRSGVQCTLNKKLITNSLNIIFDLLNRSGSRSLVTEISDFLMLSVYRAFRILHGANEKNQPAMFKLNRLTAHPYSSAMMQVCQANAEQIAAGKPADVIIPHFSCHHLRHTFCTRFCEKETNIKVIQAVMGHANIETTMDIYAEVTDAKKKEAIENLSHNLDIF